MTYICKSLCLILILFLTGCQKDYSVNYFLEHPNQLKRKIMRCQSTDEQSVMCVNARQASNIFADLIEKRVQEPEKFGLQIMQAQLQLVALKQLMNQYQAENNPKLAESTLNYQNQLHQVKVLLAVVAAMEHVE